MIPISFNLCFNILVNQAVPGHMSHRGLLECSTVTVHPRTGAAHCRVLTAGPLGMKLHGGELTVDLVDRRLLSCSVGRIIHLLVFP